MRIISIFVALLVTWTMNFPQVALAKETINTNTKIEFQVENISQVSLNIPYKYDNYIPVQDPESLKNEAILAKWKEKQPKASLPDSTFVINASAYTAAADECGKSDGITASGIKVHQGTLACPPQFPFGVKVKIEGQGTFTCEDRGGAIKGNHFDIYMNTKKEAFQFGRRMLNAEIVE